MVDGVNLKLVYISLVVEIVTVLLCYSPTRWRLPINCHYEMFVMLPFVLP